MLFLRNAASRVSLYGRRYASSTGSSGKAHILPYIFLGVGIGGFGAQAYFDYYKPKVRKVQEKSPLDPQKFVDFELKKVVPYNHNTAKFVFKLNDDEAPLLPVASCVVIKFSDPEALKDQNRTPVIRPYTPIPSSEEFGELTFLVKKYDDGKASKYIHTLKPGDKLSVKGPITKFLYKDNEFEHVGMIAGGSGITPMHQVLAHALANPENKTKFKLIFANVTEQDILLREEFDAMKQKYPDTFDIVYTLSKPSSGWTGHSGYVTGDLIRRHFPDASLGEKMKIFVCGPPGQMKAVSGPKDGKLEQGPLGGILKELGYDESQVFKF